MGNYTFTKNERLKSRKAIKNLFANGKSFNVFPLKFIVEESSIIDETNNKLLVAVPKRLIPNAADRNLLKRRIREAYRIDKSQLSPSDTKLNICILYLGRKIDDYDTIKLSVAKGIRKISDGFLLQEQFSK